MTVEQILRNEENRQNRESHRFEGGRRTIVRRIATEVIQECGHRYNTISEVRLDNHTWQVDYNDQMPFSERTVLQELIQERLQLEFPEGPYEVKLVGLGYHPR